MLLEIGGPEYNRREKDIEKFEGVIKNLLQKCDEKSLRMLELLNEEVKAKEARAEDPDDFITMRIPRWNEPFPDEYPSLEKLEKQHKERMSIAVEHHRKRMAERIKLLRDLYGSGEDDETLLTRHIFEEAAKLTKERLEKSKVKKQVMAGYISDCLKVITDWAADLDNFVPWANRMLVECIGACGNRIPAKIGGSASIDIHEKNSWRTIWEAVRPFQEKIQKTKDYLCAGYYAAAMREIAWDRLVIEENLSDKEMEQTLPEAAECPEEEVKEIMELIDLYSEYDRNGRTPEKEKVSDKLYEYFSYGSNRIVLENLPVEYALTLSGCGIGVNAVKGCFALVKRFITNNQGKADHVPGYADALAYRTNYVCTTDFSYSFKYRTLKYLRDEMKQLHDLYPDHERPQSRYAELLFSTINDSSTGKKAEIECQKELRALAWAHPGNKTVRNYYRQARNPAVPAVFP